MITGRCHCGAIAYEVSGEPFHRALCHCSDCRRHAGAPMVNWAMFPAESFKVTQGEAKVYDSSEHGRRHFCADCGTSLFYTNDAALPNMVDIQSVTFDDPEMLPPQMQVQTAERLGWMDQVETLPRFERYPSQSG